MAKSASFLALLFTTGDVKRCTGASAPVQRPASVNLPHCRTVRCTVQQAVAPDNRQKIEIFPAAAGDPQAVIQRKKELPMKILVEDETQKTIKRCKPTKIAVAYIGADWNAFISDANRLVAIIISPTLGSNPNAIKSLVKQIGWKKIYFLDELHAKTYIGADSAVIGSANLTRNGLGTEGLVELCVEVNGKETLKKLNAAFDNLKKRAQQQYPTPKLKKARLKELEKTWGAAIANRIVKNKNNNAPDFSDFELLGEDHFYVQCYQAGKFEYSDDVKAIESLIVKDIHFASSDEVEKNKWALVWRITDASKPHKTAKPHWLYIHEVFENGVIDEGYAYPKCAIQRKDLDVPSPPFEITDDVVVAFKKVIQEKDIAKHLIQDDRDIFSLAYSLKGVGPLISNMKEYIANKANAADANKRRG